MYNFMPNNNAMERAARREMKIVRLLEQLIAYCKFLKTLLQNGGETIADDADRHPLAAISCLMKVSFDDEYRHTMCNYNALQIISNLVYLDFAVHSAQPNDQCCYALRRYALMALTNLTFGDENNKATLCGQKLFMHALVGQLETAPDDLLQVTASVLRNLSWRPDNTTKVVLNKIGAVKALVQAAMHNNQNENTLKAILSALWNLSAHCSTNKMELCAVHGALAFLVDMLSFEAPSKTLKIVENAGGILRNVSSHIAVCENYRQVLRQRNCLAILLQHLKSENLTLVSNSCGTLWNLSARCHADQRYLLNNGAIPLLRSLTHSKHAMIAEGSAAALKNLLGFRQGHDKDYALEQQNSKTEPAMTNKAQPMAKIISGLQSIVLTESNSRESIYASESFSVKSLMREKSKSLDHLHRLHERQRDRQHQRVSTLALTTAAELKGSCEKIKYRSSYQETDLDQLTDFSLRYVERQVERDVESPPPLNAGSPFKIQTTTLMQTKATRKGANNEIVCIEDNVKCYQTEGTPYMISNATSVDDLTLANRADNFAIVPKSPGPIKTSSKKSIHGENQTTSTYAQYTTSVAADKPIQYCDEGTPYYFSRHESLNSLNEFTAHFGVENLPTADKKTTTTTAKLFKIIDVQRDGVRDELLAGVEAKSTEEAPPHPQPVQQQHQHEHGGHEGNTATAYSAQETPLMFSRSSSIDSLHEVDDDLPTGDDMSSVQSDFSRLASGIISPSDIPDSPTQLMSPRSPGIKVLRKLEFSNAAMPALATTGKDDVVDLLDESAKLKFEAHSTSIFEDNVNTFQVENTPAQFSCATSLSNLSIADDDVEQMKMKPMKSELKSLPVDGQKAELEAEEEEEEEECGAQANDDEFLLANCINIGMNRTTVYATSRRPLVKCTKDELTEYYTEDTPAMFSDRGSNTNLSAISILSGHHNADGVEVEQQQPPTDNVSFNTSDGSSVADETNLLQQCINDGMQTLLTKVDKTQIQQSKAIVVVEQPTCSHTQSGSQSGKDLINGQVLIACSESLSSLSTDASDDDADFLNQAIAAGYNRSKSKDHQPKSTINSSMSQQQQQQQPLRHHQQQPQLSNDIVDTIDVVVKASNNQPCNATVDSSDESSSDSDNQSKSLLELCIRTGMHKKDQLLPAPPAATAVSSTSVKHKFRKN